MNKTTRWQRLKRNGERRLAAANSQKSLPTHFDRHMILIYGSSRHERAEVLRKIPAQALLTFAIAYSATEWNSRYSGKHVFDCMVTWSAENTFRCESWVEIRLVNLQRSSLSASQDFSAFLSALKEACEEVSTTNHEDEITNEAREEATATLHEEHIAAMHMPGYHHLSATPKYLVDQLCSFVATGVQSSRDWGDVDGQSTAAIQIFVPGPSLDAGEDFYVLAKVGNTAGWDIVRQLSLSLGRL